MLTPKQERDRAIKVSQLYSPAPILSTPTQAETVGLFYWWGLIWPTIWLAGSLIVLNTIVTVFMNLGYGFKEDVAAAGMIFIAVSMGGCFLVYKAGRFFFNALYTITKYYDLLFWSALLFLIPVFLLSRSVMIDAADHDFGPILTDLGLHGLLFGAVSIGFVTLIALVLEKLPKSETVRIKIVAWLTALPYLLGFVLAWLG